MSTCEVAAMVAAVILSAVLLQLKWRLQSNMLRAAWKQQAATGKEASLTWVWIVGGVVVTGMIIAVFILAAKAPK